MKIHVPWPPFSLLLMLLGMVLTATMLWILDLPLLWHADIAEGWISNIYRKPAGEGTRPSTNIYYAYRDQRGETYRRTKPTVGFGTSGDTFTVIYHRDQPGRHLVLTPWGLILPGLFLGGGIFLLVNGYRESRWVFPIWRAAWKRHRRGEAMEQFEPMVIAAARHVQGEMARATPPLRSLDWFHHFAGADPADLSIWFVLATNRAFDDAVASGVAARIEALMREDLQREGYPANAIALVFVGFKTRESLKLGMGDDTPPPKQLSSPARRG